MKIEDLLTVEDIQANLNAGEKIEAIEEMVKLIVDKHPTLDQSTIVKSILEREKLGSTGIGNGIAIPHCKLKDIENIICCFGRSKKGVDFQSVDYLPSHIFFMLIAPEDAAGDHLKALATISRLCQSPTFRTKLIEAGNASDIYEIMLQEDQN